MSGKVTISSPPVEQTEMRAGVADALSTLDNFSNGTGSLTLAQLTTAVRTMAKYVARIIRYLARKEGWL